MQTPETSLQPRHQQESEQGACGDGAEGCQQAKPHKPHEAARPVSRVRARPGQWRRQATAGKSQALCNLEAWALGRTASHEAEAGLSNSLVSE